MIQITGDCDGGHSVIQSMDLTCSSRPSNSKRIASAAPSVLQPLELPNCRAIGDAEIKSGPAEDRAASRCSGVAVKPVVGCGSGQSVESVRSRNDPKILVGRQQCVGLRPLGVSDVAYPLVEDRMIQGMYV